MPCVCDPRGTGDGLWRCMSSFAHEASHEARRTIAVAAVWTVQYSGTVCVKTIITAVREVQSVGAWRGSRMIWGPRMTSLVSLVWHLGPRVYDIGPCGRLAHTICRSWLSNSNSNITAEAAHTKRSRPRIGTPTDNEGGAPRIGTPLSTPAGDAHISTHTHTSIQGYYCAHPARWRGAPMKGHGSPQHTSHRLVPPVGLCHLGHPTQHHKSRRPVISRFLAMIPQTCGIHTSGHAKSQL
jgi:hypothetical protein